jgi:hypothetical protein
VAKLIRVVPNDLWQLILEFEASGFRLLPIEPLYSKLGWKHFAYPNVVRHLRFTSEAILWASGETLSAEELLQRSDSVAKADFEYQSFHVGMVNRAPTSSHASHHVYYVSLAAFSDQPFRLGESIGGGHMELGGSFAFSLPELRVHEGWQDHIHLSGCDWLVPLLENFGGDQGVLVDALVRLICGLQNDTPLQSVLDNTPEIPADIRGLLGAH